VSSACVDLQNPAERFRVPAVRRAACHLTGRERTGSSTLQTLQEPILLTPWAQLSAFQTLTLGRWLVGDLGSTQGARIVATLLKPAAGASTRFRCVSPAFHPPFEF
jgi:hypothetical protein